MPKSYLTIVEQIDHLVADKNIDRGTLKERYFKEQTYLDLVNPYTDLIAKDRDQQTGKHIYAEGETFNKFLECVRLDAALSDFLRSAIGVFEKSLKSFLSHAYCRKMRGCGDDETKDFSWIDRYKAGDAVFDLLRLNEVLYHGVPVTFPSEDAAVTRRLETLDEIAELIGQLNPQNYMAKHYVEKRGYIPMFVVIHSLSLGKLLTLFQMLPIEDRADFIRFYIDDSKRKIDGLRVCASEKEFRILILIRNIVNHYEPIFPFFLNYRNEELRNLEETLHRLKEHWLRCETKHAFAQTGVNRLSFKGNSYSNAKINKIHRIVDIVK